MAKKDLKVSPRHSKPTEDFITFFLKNAIAAFICDSNSHILEVNNVAIKRYGYSRTQFLTMTIGDLNADPTDQTLKRLFKRQTAGNKLIALSLQTRKKKLIEALVSVTSIIYKRKQCRLVTCTDVKVLSSAKGTSPTAKRGKRVRANMTSETTEKILNGQNNDVVYRKLTETFPGVVFHFHFFDNETFSFPYVSNNILSLIGISADEFSTDVLRFFDKIHKEDITPLRESLLNASHAQTKWNGEFRIEISGKGVRWIRGAASPEVLHDSSVMWYGYLTDVTEEKHRQEQQSNAELAIRDAENKLQAFFHSTADVNILLGRNYEVLAFNSVATSFSRLISNKELVTGKNFVPYIPTSTIEGFKRNFHRALQGEIVVAEREVPSENSGSIWLNVSYRPALQKDGSIIGVVFNAVNIDERKRSQQEIKKLSLIASNTHSAVVFTDPNGFVTWVNEGFEKMTGYVLSEVINKKPGDLLQGSETSKATKRVMSEKQRNGERYRTEIINYAKDGTKYWLDIEVMPIIDDEGKLSGFMSVQADITLLKNSIEEARSARLQMQTIFDHSPMVVFMKDLDGRYLFFNDAYKRALNRPDLTPGMTDYDIFEREFADECRRRDRDILAKESILQFDHRVGEDDFFEMKFPIRNAKDKIFAIGGVSVKVTEKKLLEKKIAEREERLRVLADNLANGAIYQYEMRKDSTSRSLTYYSSGIELMTGLSVQALLESPDIFEARIHPENLPAYQEKSRMAMSALQVFEDEFRFQHVNGTWRWLRVRSRPILKDHDTIVWNGLVFDITEMKNAALQIEESEERFRSIADAAPVLIWLSGVDKECFYFNQPWYDFTGRTFAEEQGYGWAAGVHADDLERCVQVYTSSFDKRQSFRMTYRLRNAQGEYRWVFDTGVPRSDAVGNFLGFIGSCIDITETIEVTSQLEESQKELEKMLIEKDFLIREIHHRVKNNLQVMSSVLFLKAQTLKDPAMKQLLNDSRQRLRSMSLIHERLMQSGGQITQIDIYDYIIGLVDEQKSVNSIDEDSLKIVLDIDHHVMNLEQIVNCGFIINETLTNSVKYAFPEGHKGVVTISFKLKDGKKRLIISDDGIGLPSTVSLDNNELFGFQLIKVFTEHLGGELMLDGKNGTRWTIEF